MNPDSELTPTLDRLADEGVSYTQAVAPGPRTPSSVPILFTGEFMSADEDWSWVDWPARQRRIAQHMNRFQHLSQQLRRQGYETAAFTANPWTTRESNFDRGFDDFAEISANSDDVSSKHLSNSLLFKLIDAGVEVLPVEPFNWSSNKEWFAQWTGSFDLIRKKLSALSEPFFLWIFLLDTHQPYITPRQFREESTAWEMYYAILRYWYWTSSDDSLPAHARELVGQAYRDAVRSVDAFVASLEEEAREYDPITVFHSDHGEALGEHENFGHQQTLYEENLRVPLLIHNAGSTEVHEQVSLRSLPTMFADLAGSEEFDPEAYTQPFVVSTTEDDQLLSVRMSEWKLIVGDDRTRLYDLRSDTVESADVSETYPQITSSLTELAERHAVTQTEKTHVETATTELLDRETRL